MSEFVDKSLRKVAKGTGIILIGSILAIGMGFFTRILIVRYISQTQYGIYSLGLSVITLLGTISALGLKSGVPRQIAYCRKTDESKVGSILGSSIVFATVASVVSAVFLFSFSGYISTHIFNEAGLVKPLRIFSIALPFSVLIKLFVSFFRGLDRASPKVYFQNIGRKGILLAGIVLIIALGFSFTEILYVYVFSSIVTFFMIVFYMKSELSFDIELNFINPVGKEIILYSLPLLGVTAAEVIWNWTDTLMLGYFMPSEIVGLYQGAYPLASRIPIILGASGFLFLPILTRLNAENLGGNMKRTYQIISKWIYSISLPIFFILFLFPESVLGFIFGGEYIKASPVLRILSIGFLGHVITGPNGLGLNAIGRPKLAFYGSCFGSIANIVLNWILIPLFGILGAAISSTLSYNMRNGFVSYTLYKHSNIHPFSKNFLKPLIISASLMIPIYILERKIVVEIWMVPIFLLLYISCYVILSLLAGSISEEDLNLFSKIEDRIDWDLDLIKRILKILLR